LKKTASRKQADMKRSLFTKIEFPHFDLLIPFICRQCGTCCRTYTPMMSEKDLGVIARCLNIPENELFARHEECRRRYIAGRPLPCPFNKEKRCLIYRNPLRPEVCRLYPFSFGRPKIHGCPGYDEHSRIVDAFLAGETDFEIYDSSFCPDQSCRRAPEEEWHRFRFALSGAEPSRLAVRHFIQMNNLPGSFLEREKSFTPSFMSTVDISS
jgi:Fe-S-cluster containining protein